MKKIIALLLALVMVFALVACAATTDAPAEETKTETAATETATEEKTEEATEEPAAETAAPADFKVGFIMLHDENSTYDLNFINGAKEAAEALGVEYVIKTNVPEGQECYDAAADLADAGCNIVFADSFGHDAPSFMTQPPGFSSGAGESSGSVDVATAGAADSRGTASAAFAFIPQNESIPPIAAPRVTGRA